MYVDDMPTEEFMRAVEAPPIPADFQETEIIEGTTEFLLLEPDESWLDEWTLERDLNSPPPGYGPGALPMMSYPAK